MVLVCGLLMVLSGPATPSRWGLEGNPGPPSTIHHVGIYLGNGMMVDAPYTGAFVRIDSMYSPGGLIGAVRPAG